MSATELNVLVVNSSPRQTSSVTRRFTDEMVTELRSQHEQVNVQQRDVSIGLPFVNENWVNASFTPELQTTDENNAALSISNHLVDELKTANIIIIAAPIYNFGIPASLKAWIDQVARVGLTFYHTENGPVGMLENKKAYIVIASGGTKIGSEIDFASSYLRHVLGFIGISDVSMIPAQHFDKDNELEIANIRARITDLAQQAL